MSGSLDGLLLSELAERIVDARKGSHPPTAYDECPCCGYDGMWSGDRESAITEVLTLLHDAIA
jgi:hypothetical protein